VRDVLTLLAPDLAGNEALVAAIDQATLKPAG
jgi:fructuronate reductase